VRKEREREKAYYFNHHYEQMFFGLLVIIFVSAHIPDGGMAKRYAREYRQSRVWTMLERERDKQQRWIEMY